jgi:hypothetical protein
MKNPQRITNQNETNIVFKILEALKAAALGRFQLVERHAWCKCSSVGEPNYLARFSFKFSRPPTVRYVLLCQHDSASIQILETFLDNRL